MHSIAARSGIYSVGIQPVSACLWPLRLTGCEMAKPFFAKAAAVLAVACWIGPALPLRRCGEMRKRQRCYFHIFCEMCTKIGDVAAGRAGEKQCLLAWGKKGAQGRSGDGTDGCRRAGKRTRVMDEAYMTARRGCWKVYKKKRLLRTASLKSVRENLT